MSKKLILGIAVLLLAALVLVSCDGTSDGTDTATQAPTTTAATTATAPPTDDITSTPTQPPTTEPEDSAPLVCFLAPSSDWHNYFAFEIENYVLRYQAIRYDYYHIDSDSINGVAAGDFIACVGDLWNDHNTCFLVYYSQLDGKLHYKVIDPYAIPGTDPDRGDMAATYEGILEGDATSVSANYVRFTYWGKYGVHVNWTDDNGQGHYAVIDQWSGVTEKGSSDADDRPAVREATARGRLVLTPDYLETTKQNQEAGGGIVNWVKEDGNHLELNFDLDGGDVSGSYWWQHSWDVRWSYRDPEYPTQTIVTTKIVDLTGTYSGGETGTFEGEVTGSMTSAFNGQVYESTSASLEGTWTAEMDASGRISGTMHYAITYPETSFEEWMEFEATLE